MGCWDGSQEKHLLPTGWLEFVPWDPNGRGDLSPASCLLTCACVCTCACRCVEARGDFGSSSGIHCFPSKTVPLIKPGAHRFCCTSWPASSGALPFLCFASTGTVSRCQHALLFMSGIKRSNSGSQACTSSTWLTGLSSWPPYFDCDLFYEVKFWILTLDILLKMFEFWI